VTSVAAGCSLGRTPKASNPQVSLPMESFEGSSGDICSGHAADVDDVDKKLAEGLSRPLLEEIIVSKLKHNYWFQQVKNN